MEGVIARVSRKSSVNAIHVIDTWNKYIPLLSYIPVNNDSVIKYIEKKIKNTVTDIVTFEKNIILLLSSGIYIRRNTSWRPTIDWFLTNYDLLVIKIGYEYDNDKTPIKAIQNIAKVEIDEIAIKKISDYINTFSRSLKSTLIVTTPKGKDYSRTCDNNERIEKYSNSLFYDTLVIIYNNMDEDNRKAVTDILVHNESLISQIYNDVAKQYISIKDKNDKIRFMLNLLEKLNINLQIDCGDLMILSSHTKESIRKYLLTPVLWCQMNNIKQYESVNIFTYPLVVKNTDFENSDEGDLETLKQLKDFKHYIHR